jgi:hypothetical protein
LDSQNQVVIAPRAVSLCLPQQADKQGKLYASALPAGASKRLLTIRFFFAYDGSPAMPIFYEVIAKEIHISVV